MIRHQYTNVEAKYVYIWEMEIFWGWCEVIEMEEIDRHGLLLSIPDPEDVLHCSDKQ